jgi:hypothetical protein
VCDKYLQAVLNYCKANAIANSLCQEMIMMPQLTPAIEKGIVQIRTLCQHPIMCTLMRSRLISMCCLFKTSFALWAIAALETENI